MKALVFSGTTEGREICHFLMDCGYYVAACVATEYGRECAECDCHEIRTGRLTDKEMSELMRDFDIIIDATHPYAVEVTENIKRASSLIGKECIRLLRDAGDTYDAITVKSISEAVSRLKNTEGDIFISTGSKDIESYTDIAQRSYIRVLDTCAAHEKCAGFEKVFKRIIYKMPPYGIEENISDFNGAKYLITKNSGKNGGFDEKLEAAKRLGMNIIIIDRPHETGMTIDEVKEMVKRIEIKVGSRESRLAVIQSEIVIDKIKAAMPEVKTRLVTMKTTGDKILDRTLDKIGGKGLFVKELDAALLDGRVDITVHSLKDMPMETDPRIPIAAYTKRENPYDVLVLPLGQNKLDLHKPIGCSSSRRAIQLKELYPECEIKPVRGNVLTRLNKLDSGEYGALILAAAGLIRLGLEDRISRVFTAEEMLPAACQGIIAVQTRADFQRELLKAVNDTESEICALTERAFTRRLNGGCSSPAAAFAVLEGDKIKLAAMNVKDGRIIKKTKIGDVSDGEKIAVMLAEEMI